MYELSEFYWQFSLGGLPLYLLQTVACIRYRRCSFPEYIELYRDANEKKQLMGILQRINDFAFAIKERRVVQKEVEKYYR